MRRLLGLLGWIALLSGCLPDLSDYYVVDPSEPRRDGGPTVRVDAGVDAGPSTGGPCGLPHLLVAVENLTGGAGRILRYELPPGGGVRACRPLTAQGALMQQPFAVAGVTDRFVLVAGRDGVMGVDPMNDTLRFQLPRLGDHPNDAFALYDESRRDWVGGVAWSGIGTSSDVRGPIRNVLAYSAEGGERWAWSGTSLGISSCTALTSSPRDPSELVALHPNLWAAAEVDPFGQVIRSSPPLVPPIGGTVVTTISGGTGGGVAMLAWGGRVDGQPRMLTLEGPFTDDIFQVTCGERACRFEHVAVDPSRPRAVLGLCELDGRREVVRLDFEQTVCEPLVGPDAVPTSMRMSYLSFVQAR